MNNPSKLVSARLMAMLLCLVGVAISCVALYEHVVYTGGLATGPSFCNISRHVNCEAVNASAWSTFLGVPIASYGVFFYLSLFGLLLISGPARRVQPYSALAVAWLGSVSAVGISVVLFGVSEFIIGALCLICLGLYVVNFLLWLVLWRGVTRGSAARSLRDGVMVLLGFVKTVFTGGSQATFARLGAIALVAFAAVCVYLPYGVHAVLSATMSQEPNQSGTTSSKQDPFEAWQTQTPISIPSNTTGGTFRDYDEGEVSAPIQIVEFADFECPGCRRLYVALKDILKQYEGKYHLTFRNYPLDQECNPKITREFHRNACLAAYFTRCAGEQGKFWEALDLVFTDPILEDRNASGKVKEFLLTKGAASLSLDSEAMVECIASGRYRAKLQDDIKEGDKAGLTSTPSLWINGKKVEHPTRDVVAKVLQAVAQGN